MKPFSSLLSNCIALAIFLATISCNEEPAKSPAQLRQELEWTEGEQPSTHLSIVGETTYTPKRVLVREGNLFRSAEYEYDGAVVNGIISNDASIATFKDVVLWVTYTSQTGTQIGKETFTLYEFFEPGQSTEFNLHVHAPANTKSYNVILVNGTWVNSAFR